jgi:hypothetical protein
LRAAAALVAAAGVQRRGAPMLTAAIIVGTMVFLWALIALGDAHERKAREREGRPPWLD